jgi:hypothetical protein
MYVPGPHAVSAQKPALEPSPILVVYQNDRRTVGKKGDPGMVSRTDLSAGLVVATFAMGSAPAVLAEAIVEAKNWNDAISKLHCDDISKNADGSFSVKGIVQINGEQHDNPMINVPKYTAKLNEKKCDQRETSSSTVSATETREPVHQ